MTCPNLKLKQELADDTLLFLTPVNSASLTVSLDGLPISCQVPSLVWSAATQAGIYHFIAQHWKQPQLSVPPLCKIILQPLFFSSVFHQGCFSTGLKASPAAAVQSKKSKIWFRKLFKNL